MPRAATPKPQPEPDLNWYGLPKFGYDESVVPLSGDPVRDQVTIESLCFRISHATHEGGLGRFGHFKRIVDLLWNNKDTDSRKRYTWGPWGERMIYEMCEEPELGVAGCANAGKSDPAALYAVVSYITDPTHTLVLVLSTTIKEAKKRIWKTLKEYWLGIPNLPGKALWSTNEIRGMDYNGKSFGESSGIYLMAGDQSKESEAVNRLIGIKSPKTGEPAETYEEIVRSGEFHDLMDKFDEETLRDLLPRLVNLSDERTGKLIILIDEMTGVSSAVLDAIMSNMKFGNAGHIQIVGLGNPDKIYDTFGRFCTPQEGWDRIALSDDDEWETATGGKCIRFDAEKNPRITLGDDRYHWLPTRAAIDNLIRKYGEKSRYYIRMVKAKWTLEGGDEAIYSPADIELSGSRKADVVWGYVPPVPVSFLDPAFTAGGDRALASFGLVGEDIEGNKVLLLTDRVAVKVDVNNTAIPVNYQIVHGWRKECRERGVKPENAAYDRTGGGIPFGDIVFTQWSPLVTGITSGGPASKNPLPGEFKPGTKTPVLANERFANRATEIWYAAHPLFRSQQIFGIGEELAKELCTRQHDKAGGGKLKVEVKRVYRDREGKSPDESDSFLGMVDFCRTKFKLLPLEKGKALAEMPMTDTGRASMQAFKERARRISNRKNLKR